MNKLRIKNLASCAVTVTGENVLETIESGESADVCVPEGTRLNVSPACEKTFSVRIGNSRSKVNWPYDRIVHPVLCFTLSSSFTVKSGVKSVEITCGVYCSTTSILLNVFLVNNRFPESCGYCKRLEKFVLCALHFFLLIMLGVFALLLAVACIYDFATDFSGISFFLLLAAVGVSWLCALWYKATRKWTHIEKFTAEIANDLKPVEILQVKGDRYLKFNELDI